MNSSTILIATLGSEPQVATAALDLLRLQGEEISELRVLHTSRNTPIIAAALSELQDAASWPGYVKRVTFVFEELKDKFLRPLDDVETRAAGEAVFRHLYRLVREAKLAGSRVHLSIAGGRKTMSVFGMATAQMLFDEDDRLWHLYSAGEFLKSRRLHPGPGDDVQLIPIPFLPWSDISPVLLDFGKIDDPFDALKQRQMLRLRAKIDRARTFMQNELTEGQARVVEMLVQTGGSDMELSKLLHISHKTVGAHLERAYDSARVHFGLLEINRSQLISLLSLYMESREPDEA